MSLITRILTFILSLALLSGCTKGGSDDSVTGVSLSNALCPRISISEELSPRISNGNRCETPETSPVIRLLVADENDEVFGLCSGTLVTPDTILTAAHCVDRFLGIHKVFVDINNDLNNLTEASETIIHPLWFHFAGDPNDIGIVKVSSPITTRPTVPILLSSSLSVGDRVGIYGYGFDENDEIGNLKEGEMVISEIGGFGGIFAEFDATGMSICSGDSGGPAIFSHNGLSGIIAINSAGSAEGCLEGSVALFASIQLSSNLDFILENIPGINAL